MTDLQKSNIMRFGPQYPTDVRPEQKKPLECGPVPFPEFSCEESTTCVDAEVPYNIPVLHQNRDTVCYPLPKKQQQDPVFRNSEVGNTVQRVSHPAVLFSSATYQNLWMKSRPVKHRTVISRPVKFATYQSIYPSSVSIRDTTKNTRYPNKMLQNFVFKMRPSLADTPRSKLPQISNVQISSKIAQSASLSSVPTQNVPLRNIGAQYHEYPNEPPQYPVYPNTLSQAVPSFHHYSYPSTPRQGVQHQHPFPRNVQYRSRTTRGGQYRDNKSRGAFYRAVQYQSLSFPSRTISYNPYSQGPPINVPHQNNMPHAAAYYTDNARGNVFPANMARERLRPKNPSRGKVKPKPKSLVLRGHEDFEYFEDNNADYSLKRQRIQVRNVFRTSSTMPPFPDGCTPEEETDDPKALECIKFANCYTLNWKITRSKQPHRLF